MSDNKFTNDVEIVYPTLNDVADIRVINNNIKILNEQKASLDNLENVARESSHKNIENKVTDINNRILTTATQTSVNSVQNTVNTMNSTMNNINSVVNSINSKGNIKSVQRGVRNFTSTSSQSISISTINPQKSIVILNGGIDQNIQASIGIIVTSATPYLLNLSSNSISIGISVYNGTNWANTMPVSWQVIEFY